MVTRSDAANRSSESLPTVGVLYCGDLGTAFARLLRQAGVHVVTTTAGRSAATQARARAAGVEILPGLDDVVRASQFVFSVVLPDAAVEVARQYADRRSLRPIGSVFVDMNSIGVEDASEIEATLRPYDIPLVDATIHGTAARLADLGLLYVSGPSADRVAALCKGTIGVRPLGSEVGAATRMKLLLAGLSKGMNALFLEVGALAQKAGMLEGFLEGCQHFYPGVMTAIDRMLPTYPQHAARRAVEMESVSQLAQSYGSPHGMTSSAAELLRLAALSDWGEQPLAGVGVPDVIRTFAEGSGGSMHGHRGDVT